MRLLLAALVIIAAAGPQWNPPLATMKARAPIAIMIDDGWAAAATWDARLRTADDIIARAESDHRAVALIPLSEGIRDISFATAGSARVRLHQIKPAPHTVDRTEALPAISRFLADAHDVELIWLSDGIDLGRGGEFVKDLAQTLDNRAMTIVTGGIPAPRALTAADNAAGALSVKVLRAAPARPRPARCARSTSRACRSARRPSRSSRPIARPSRNSICRSKFATILRASRSPASAPREPCNCSTSAGAAARSASCPARLPTRRSRCCRQATTSPARSGRSPTCGLRKAKSPAEAVTHFLDQHMPMLILADVGNVAGEAHDRLARWVEDGGVLVRFAGPRLAASDDDLVPVQLRRGGRTLGGSLSWDKPQPLAAFSRESPFTAWPCPTT